MAQATTTEAAKLVLLLNEIVHRIPGSAEQEASEKNLQRDVRDQRFAR